MLANIANAAREAAAALKGLAAGTQIKAVKIQMAAAAGVTTTQVVKTQPQKTVSDLLDEEAVGGFGPRGKNPLKTKGPAPLTERILKELSEIRYVFRNLFGFGALLMILKKVVSSLTELLKSTMKASLGLDRFTQQTGVPLRELKKWELVGAKAGLDATAFAETMSSIRQTAMEVQKNQNVEATVAFTRLGLNMFARPDEILKAFAAKTAGMKLDQAQSWGKEIGIGPEQVYALRQYGAALNALFKGAELSDHEQGAVLELNNAWKEMTFTMGLLRDKLVAGVAPAVRDLVEMITKLEQFLTAHKAARDWLFHPAQQIANQITGLVPDSMLAKTSAEYLGRRAGAAASVTNNVTNNIEGVEDAAAVKRAVEQANQRMFNNTLYQRAPAGSCR